MSSNSTILEKKCWKETKEKRKKWKEAKTLKKIAKNSEQLLTSTAKNKLVKNEVKPFSTISIAVPGSILENAQTLELRTYLVGQIARAASIFQIDEIIVFDDYCGKGVAKRSDMEEADGVKTARHCCVQLGRILQYLECPQYLRKDFFPVHNDLKYAGILNPLDAPHHLRRDDEFIFREGIVTNKPIKEGKGSLVNIGLYNDVRVDKDLCPGIRVTVRLLPKIEGSKKMYGEVVSPHLPRSETGIYWGYNVRLTNSLSEVLTECPYENGYDLTIGTSDKGTSIDDVTDFHFNHALIVFGGLQGLEEAVENDENLHTEEPSDLFEYYLNTLPHQGSRTIRTEEAVILSLAALRTKLQPKNKLPSFISSL